MTKPEKSVYERAFGKPVGVEEISILSDSPVILLTKNKDGVSVLEETTLEKERASLLVPDYRDVKLQTLIENGVDPKHLDVQSDDRLGSEAEFERLAQHLENNKDSLFSSLD